MATHRFGASHPHCEEIKKTYCEGSKWKKIRDLQRLLTKSTAAEALAVRRVTENKGKRTAGIDKTLWITP